MKLKLDENLSRRLRPLLESRGHDVDTVVDEVAGRGSRRRGGGRRPTRGARPAHPRRRLRRHRPIPPGSHPGIVVIRVPEPRPSLVTAALTGLLARHDLADLAGCTVIAQLGAVRIRRPAD